MSRRVAPLVLAIVAAASCAVDDRPLLSRRPSGEAGVGGDGARGGSDAGSEMQGDAGDHAGEGGSGDGAQGGDQGTAAGGTSGRAGSPSSGGSSAGNSSESGGVAGASGGGAGTSSGAPPSGGASSVGGAGAGGSIGGAAGSLGGVAGLAGSSGGGAGGVIARPCGDMDGNDVDDCSETLVTNSAFDIDASGWWPESGVTVEWVSRDFDDFDDSGALQVTFTETGAGDQLLMAGAQQCLPSIDEGNYQVGSHFFRGGGQDGWAGVNILFFGEADCTGALVGSQTLPLDAGEDAWLTTQSRVAVPPTVTSLMVRLVAIKPANAASLVVLFDGILARQK